MATEQDTAPGRRRRRAGDRPDTRARLLDAAADVFAAKGYSAASVDDVAAAAGLTKGAVYWHFESKDDLFLALLEDRVYAPFREAIDFATNAPGGEGTAHVADQRLSEHMDRDRALILLETEHWLLAVRDSQARERLAAMQRDFRDAVAAALGARALQLGAPVEQFAVSATDVATAYYALANGLSNLKLSAPDLVSDGLFGEIVSLVYEGLVARALGLLPEQHRRP